MNTFKFVIKNGHIHIDFLVTPNIRFRKSIGEWIDSKKWNAKKFRTKNNSTLNKYLDEIENLCYEIKYKLNIEKKLSSPNYKNEFNRRFGLDDSLLFKDWVVEFRDSKDPGSTYFDTYDAIINKHFKYIPNSTINGLCKEYFLEVQEAFKKKSNLAGSSINCYMNFLLIAANAAFDKYNIKELTQFWRIKPVKSFSVRNIVLSDSEVDLLWKMDLMGFEDFARDQFLIGCYTGTRYKMYSKLDHTYLHNGVLKASAVKRHYHFDIIAPNRLQTLLSGISKKREKFCLKNAGSAYDKFEKILPVLGQKAGINQIITRTNRFGEDETFEKFQEIESHTARRTFCHINYRITKNMTLEDIQKHLGHKSQKTTERYLDNVL